MSGFSRVATKSILYSGVPGKCLLAWCLPRSRCYLLGYDKRGKMFRYKSGPNLVPLPEPIYAPDPPTMSLFNSSQDPAFKLYTSIIWNIGWILPFAKKRYSRRNLVWIHKASTKWTRAMLNQTSLVNEAIQPTPFRRGQSSTESLQMRGAGRK